MRSILCQCLVLLLFAAGCVNVDYVGQTFEPIPEGKPVEYFGARKEVPPGKYRIIGRAVISTTRRFDKYDAREFLIDEARKRGADAVVVIHHKRVKRGVYEHSDDVAAVDISPVSNSSTVEPGGGELKISLDASEPLKGEHHYRFEQEVRVLFLKNKEDLEQQLARRGRELDRLVRQPDPAKTPEKTPTAPQR